ncbi:Hypothetical predicted protein [Podarcis lilfordi]|uniref:Uncharacterized protein n=1 Tax=Podarcis lilfordi TaxID=74358 RepID=A0AA35JW13_9SAUR|nr:Hypothetical predicted protein [Podarcis lilfordi]
MQRLSDGKQSCDLQRGKKYGLGGNGLCSLWENLIGMEVRNGRWNPTSCLRSRRWRECQGKVKKRMIAMSLVDM